MAWYFQGELSRRYFGKFPLATNLDGLGTQLGRMLREGITYAQIKIMIDLFVRDLEPDRLSAPPWIAFLGARQRLLRDAGRVHEAAVGRTADRDYWISVPRREQQSREFWTDRGQQWERTLSTPADIAERAHPGAAGTEFLSMSPSR